MNKILAGVDVALGLIKAGTEIYDLLKGKTDLTNAELNEMIEAQNKAQAAARQKLIDLLSV